MQIIQTQEAMQRWSKAGDRLSGIFSREVLEAMELRRYTHGETLCSVGDRLNGLLVLIEGKLKIHTLLPNGKSMLMRFARPVSVIGDVELMNEYPVKNQVEAVGDCLLLHAGRKLLLGEMESNPAFLRFLVGELSHKLYTLGQSSAINLLYPVENRFASYLLSLMTDNEGGKRREELSTSSMTETAEMLGTSYRHLNRVVRRFAEEGIIERRRGRLIVLDEARLTDLASGNMYE